ncbi:MAG: hypothetical protein IT371_10380 [Deltaproteobacteria bacterium]|nr:hypothetical protein [Deltaproteobacteria bacterium]
MEQNDWKWGWRLWSPRSTTEALDTRTGDRVVLRLVDRRNGRTLERFGPNVGQPLAAPPRHLGHHDLPELAGGLRLGCWTQDGCHELELDRPEAHLQLLVADSRSLACGPSDDPVMRQGVLLVLARCLRLAEGIECELEATGGEPGAPLRTIALADGPVVTGGRVRLAPGENFVAVGRMPETIQVAKALKRLRQATSYVTYYGKDQLSGPARMGHAVRWNVCFDEQRRDVYLPVNRAWVEMLARVTGCAEQASGPLSFTWDVALSVLLVARATPALGRGLLRAVLADTEESGRVPGLRLGPHRSTRTGPPLLPLAAWYLCYDGHADFAAEVFPALARGHRWLMEHRRGGGEGLLAWSDGGADGLVTDGNPLHISGWVGAAYESGLDDSPMWEELGFDPVGRRLGQACLDLTSLGALSARCLAGLAELIGEDPEPYRADYRRIHAAVNQHLWGEDGRYHNLRLDWGRGGALTPTAFYPLAAGLAPADRAQETVTRVLAQHETFWRPPVLPSLARNAPDYDGDGDYWRGRIWPPMSFLVWAGLRQSSPALASQLAEQCRALFDGEWERHGHIHENYSALTGQGEPQPGTYARSCPMYCWGGLLLLPDVEGRTGSPIDHLPRIAC